MIFYFDFRMYARMLRLARRERDPARRRRLYLTLLVVVPVVAVIHATFWFLDPIVFPDLRNVEIRTPVFILGHARSGTTLMHRLMCLDPDRFSYFRLYEMFVPSLIEKKIVRGLGWLDHHILGARIDARIAAAERERLAATQDMHATGLRSPEEDDFVLTCSLASGFWIVLMPYMGELDFYHIDERSPRARQRLMGFYSECIKRQLYVNGSRRIHLSKNPVFAGRVESLIETFPDARLIVLLRDPSETIPSLLKLLQTNWQLRKWDEPTINRSLRVLADQSFHTYRYPVQVLQRHPEVAQAIVDYRDLVADPKHTIEDVYRQIGFTVSEDFDRVLAEAQRRSGSHETAHRYSLEEFGLRADEIRTELADLFEAYGWDTEQTKERQVP
jgi:hypothetical protein